MKYNGCLTTFCLNTIKHQPENETLLPFLLRKIPCIGSNRKGLTRRHKVICHVRRREVSVRLSGQDAINFRPMARCETSKNTFEYTKPLYIYIWYVKSTFIVVLGSKEADRM